MKKQVFASALKRMNREIGRLEAAERRPTLAESARRALELKRADRVRHRPSAGRPASHGRSLPNQGNTALVDQREVGRVSQAGKRRRRGATAEPSAPPAIDDGLGDVGHRPRIPHAPGTLGGTGWVTAQARTSRI